MSELVPNRAADILKEFGPGGLEKAVKNGEVKSLTDETAIQRLKMAMNQELSAVGAHEFVMLPVPKIGKDGKPELDSDGFEVLVDKKVRKTELIRRKYEAKLKKLNA